VSGKIPESLGPVLSNVLFKDGDVLLLTSKNFHPIIGTVHLEVIVEVVRIFSISNNSFILTCVRVINDVFNSLSELFLIRIMVVPQNKDHVEERKNAEYSNKP